MVFSSVLEGPGGVFSAGVFSTVFSGGVLSVAASPPRFTGLGWGAVLFIGGSSGVGYFLWLWALAHATPTRVTVFLPLSPLTAAALGALLLGEPLSARLGVGVVAVVLGLALAHWRAEPTVP